MVLKEFCNKWVGVPFVHGGRDENGMDCYGIVIVYLNELGIDVPDFQYPEKWAKEGNNLFMENIERFPNLFEKVDMPKAGDIALFNGINNVVDHIGIFIAKDRFLHSARGVGVAISPFNQLYKRKLYGFYRVKSCTKS
jgi:cell wall-associated NlpC family hydrolase